MIALTGPALPPLPPALRAAGPPERRGLRRDEVRLLVVDRGAAEVRHTRFRRLGDFLGSGDLLVVNTSRVLPAGVHAVRESGEALQLRPCIRRRGRWDALAVQAGPPFANVALTPGEVLRAGEHELTVLGRRPDIPLLWQLRVSPADLDLVLRHGEPIRYSYVPEPVALDRYQTVYASRPGSAEAPSAGRPLSWAMLRELRAGGVALADLVLHTGLSSFQDDDFDAEHHLFEEWFEVGPRTARAVAAARRVVAVGTTVVRALESSAGADGRVRATTGWTSLAIGPARPPCVVDALLTGLHEPQASHFDLLRAFVPEPLLRRAYAEAVEHGYLWHEFGDSMLIV